MKHAFTTLLACAVLALGAPSLLTAAGSVTLSNLVQTPAGNPPNGIPVTVTVTAAAEGGASIDGVYLLFRTLAGGAQNWWITNEMDWVSGDTYTGTIPPLAEGDVEYRVSCRYNAGEVEETDVAQYEVGDVPSIASGRYMDFTGGWTMDGTYVNGYFDVDNGAWTAVGVSSETYAFRIPPGGTQPVFIILSEVGNYIQSPKLEGGIGTIYYTSQLSVKHQSGRVLIQVSTNDAPGASDWETVHTLIYPYVGYAPYPLAEPVSINRADVKFVRFYLDEASPYDGGEPPWMSDGAIAFDNIVLSYPPADIRIEDRLRNPGYPSRDQEVRLRCAVSDTNTNAPAVNHRVTVYYQWQQQPDQRPQDAWLSTNMYPVGDGVYEAAIPRSEPGYVYYYYQCAFDGFSYSRDPDGVGTGTQGIHSENQSPNYWHNGESLADPPVYFDYNNTARYQIRAFRSEYGTVWADATPVSASVPMDLVGDEVWQGITPVTGITNLNWYFVGYGRYTNDAAAFQEAPVVWGDDDQSFANPPIGGYVEVNATNPIVAIMEYTGSLLMRFSTVGLDYIGKRAVFQNFNDWLASKTEFEESRGQGGIQTFSEDFDAWRDDGPGTPVENTFEQDPPASLVNPSVFQTKYEWLAQQARVLEERKTSSQQTTANKALLLSRLGSGWVGNGGGSLTEGIEKLDWRARASFNDTYYAVYSGGYSWAHGQQITAVFRADQLSPEFPYISTLVSFQLGIPRPSFYEVRLIQGDETEASPTDRQIVVEVYRWNADESPPTKLAGSQTWDVSLAADHTVLISVSGTSSVTISVKVDTFAASTFTDNTADRLPNGGTVGFLTHDAVPMIKSVKVTTYPTTTTTHLDQSNFDSVSAWNLSPRPGGGGNRWSTVSYSGTTRLTRAVPTQQVSVWMAPARPGATQPDPPDVPGATVTNEYALSLVDTFDITTLAYTTFSQSLKQWSRSFIKIQYDSGEADVVVDDTTLFPWRAATRGTNNLGTAQVNGVDYFDWTGTAQQDEWLNDHREEWTVLEGIVTNAVYNPANNEVHLEKSRANPALKQALVSPLLTNGLGTISFSYSVSGGTAVYAVDYTEEGLPDQWATEAEFTDEAGTSGKRYQTIRKPHAGRIRIRLTDASDAGAKLMISAVEARDFPPSDETTWKAYNVMVTDMETTRLFEGQSCYLNNDPTNQVRGADTGTVLDEHQPYVQTPSIGTGIGEVAFWFRSWTGTTPTVLTLRVAPDADTPDEQWSLVTNLTVAAGTSFVYFDNPRIYDLTNHVLRLYGSLGGTDRICLDNVMVAEPVRASFEIQDVRLVPAQPLASGPVAVEVDIGRFLMNPQNVKIYLSYNTDSNTWGVANWWTCGDSPGSRRLELQPVAPGSRTYRTEEEHPIPAAAVDAVVQFYAWGTHYEPENGGSPDNPNQIFQTEATFANPEWYAPVDLNLARQAEGWSPYYIVYSCPPYSVWVNEVNPKPFTPYTGEYIELAGPAQTPLGGWRIEVINYSTRVPLTSCTIADFTLANQTNGWGFFVWGDPNVANVDLAFLNATLQNVPPNAGLHLYRSCGALEQKLCWGSTARPLLEPLGYGYAGNKTIYSQNSLSLTTLDEVEAGATREDFYWPDSAFGTTTPGAVNNNQRLADIAPPPSGYLLLISVIGPHGTHDYSAELLISAQVEAGTPVQIPYAADPWYRIATFESNGAPVDGAAGASNFLWQVASVDTDISNHVTFAAVGTYGPGVPVEWLQNWSEPAVAAGDGDPFDVGTEYLLNTDPTLDTTAALRVTDVGFSGGTLHVTVVLDRDPVSKLGDINGTLWLQSRESLLSGAFEDVASTDITGGQFNDGEGGDSHTYTFPGVTDDRRFYRATIK